MMKGSGSMKMNRVILLMFLLVASAIVAGCTEQEIVQENAPPATVEEQVASSAFEVDVDGVAEEGVMKENVTEESSEEKSSEVVLSETVEVELGMLDPEATLEREQLAPDFALKTLSGEVVKLSDYRGKLVLLNFWTTW